MGFTSTDKSIFSPDMPQTPENVRKVLDIAGWTAEEAADALGVRKFYIQMVLRGSSVMRDELWKELLDKAGRRAFDADQ